MRRTFFLVLIFVCGIAPAGETPRPRGSRALSGWFNVTAENGWRGRRYMDGEQVFAEEFAAGATGRIDVWRFYRRGVLTSEERDLNGDGKVDFQTRRDPRNGLMVSVLRDTTMRGINDLEIERTGNTRWEIREDRNLDGVTDRVLFVNAPNDLFDSAATELAGRSDVVGLVPRESWREMWSDDGYTGNITDYFRYNNSGVLGYYGQWDGRRIDWQRCAPDFVPPGAMASAPAMPQQPQFEPQAQFAQQQQYEQQTQFAQQPPAQPETIRDPFDLSAGTADADPYAGMYAQQPAPQDAAAPMPDPFGGIGGVGGSPEPEYTPAPAQPQQQQQQPQPRMTRLPTDESSARSLPARMRPPGSSARRPSRF